MPSNRGAPTGSHPTAASLEPPSITPLLPSMHCRSQNPPESSHSIGAHAIVVFWGPVT